MKQHAEIIYDQINENQEYNEIINKVINECFSNEGLDKLNIYISITLISLYISYNKGITAPIFFICK